MNASKIGQLAVRDVMHVGLIRCAGTTPMSEIAAMMAAHRIHSVVINADDEQPPDTWGVVSDLDVTAALVARPLSEQTAEGSASTPTVLISEDDSLLRAAELMTANGVSHLIAVAEGTHRPTGVISTLDLAQAVSAD